MARPRIAASKAMLKKELGGILLTQFPFYYTINPNHIFLYQKHILNEEEMLHGKVGFIYKIP